MVVWTGAVRRLLVMRQGGMELAPHQSRGDLHVRRQGPSAGDEQGDARKFEKNMNCYPAQARC
jgi:hypothetical protein